MKKYKLTVDRVNAIVHGDLPAIKARFKFNESEAGIANYIVNRGVAVDIRDNHRSYEVKPGTTPTFDSDDESIVIIELVGEPKPSHEKEHDGYYLITE